MLPPSYNRAFEVKRKMELDQVLNGEVSNDEPMGEPQVTEPVAQEPVTEPEPQEQEPAEAAPPAAKQEAKTVPLDALEAERKQRKDWKERALRLEGELAAYQRQQQQAQQPEQEYQPADPLEAVQAQVLNERFNMSEMIARRDYQDLDEKLEVFSQAAAKNPALAAQLRTQPHPWDWMYKEAQKIQLMNDIGDNPASYREKLETELRAKLMAEIGQTQAAPAPTPAAAPAAQIPQSLATARSAGARSAPVWTGPSSLDSILKTR